MSQYPNNNPYGPNPSNPNYPSQPNYPPMPDTGYGSGQSSTVPGSGYGQYAPPPSGPGDPTPNSNYGPYAPPPPPMPAPAPDPYSGAGAYDPTLLSQQSGPAYPSYPQAGGPAYPLPGGGPAYPPPAAPPLVPPPPVKKSNGGRIALISVIALLVIVGGVLGVVLFNNHQVAVQHTDATATSQSQATGTVQANANATVNAEATATYVKTHYPFSSNLVLDDPLKDSSNVSKYGWDQGTACAFKDGAYDVTISQAGFFQFCEANSTNFANFTYEVQMSIQSGGNGAEGGLVFRLSNSNQFYLLTLDTQGSYELDIRENSNGSGTRTLKTGTVPSYAGGFDQVHTIGVVANQAQIWIYIDGNQVAQVNDATYTSGQIGLVSQYGTSATTVAYNNAKVWQIA